MTKLNHQCFEHQLLAVDSVTPGCAPYPSIRSEIVPTFDLIKSDWNRAPGGTARKLAGIAILDPLFAIILYRLSSGLYHKPVVSPLAWIVRAASAVLYGTDIHPAAQIGPGLALIHTQGIVIGPRVKAGHTLTLQTRVTLGEDANGHSPEIGDNVVIHTGACVFGNIFVANNAVIGANAVVLRNVPEGHVAVGVPARTHPVGLE